MIIFFRSTVEGGKRLNAGAKEKAATGTVGQQLSDKTRSDIDKVPGVLHTYDILGLQAYPHEPCTVTGAALRAKPGGKRGPPSRQKLCTCKVRGHLGLRQAVPQPTL